MIARFIQPDYSTQSGTVYPLGIDSAFSLMARLSAQFAAHEQSSPDMTVAVEAGSLFATGVLTEVAAQNTGTITAPSTDPRIDRVVIGIDGVVSVITGTEDPSPVAPIIPADKMPICQIALTTGTTEITNSIITDERSVFSLPVLDEDDMTSNSAVALSTQQAVKAYIDNIVQREVGATYLNGIGTVEAITVTTTPWTVPAGVHRLKVTIVGGGGGGAGGTFNVVGGGGGGSGGCAIEIIDVNPSDTINITIGAGGAGGGSSTAGGAGGTSSFGAFCSANGGGGGFPNTSGSYGGAGGTATGGDLNLTGNGGGNAATATNGHGQGAASILGGGPQQQPAGLTGGAAAQGYGAGGGGGGGNLAGGAGSAGICIIEY